MINFHIVPGTNEQPHLSRNTRLVSLLTTLLRDYGLEPIVRVSVISSPIRPDERIVRIEPAELGMPAYYYLNVTQRHGLVDAYKAMLKDGFRLLGKTDYESAVLAEDAYYYERRIAEILPKIEVEHERGALMRMHELVMVSGTIPIQEILSNYFTNLNGGDYVWVTSPDYLRRLSHVFSHTDDRSLFGYLKTIAVKRLLTLYSPSFRHSINNFKYLITGVGSDRPQWEFCASLVDEITPLGFQGFIKNYREHMFEYGQLVRSVENMFNHIKRSFHVEIDSSPNIRNISSIDKKELLDKMKAIKIQVGLPLTIAQDAYLKDFHQNLYITNNYHSNLLRGFSFKVQNLQHFLTSNLTYDENLLFNMMQIRKVTYEKSINTVLVPYYLTATPNFHERFPLSVQYGRLGVMIAEALTSAMVHVNESLLLDTNNTNLFYDIKTHTMDNIHRCENRSIERLRMQIAKKIIENTMVEMIGLKMAGQGMMRDLAGQTEHKHLPGLEKHEDGEVFMLSYLQNECAIITLRTDVWNEVTEYKLPSMTLLEMKITLMHNFFNDFSCPRKMYHIDRKCLLLHENVFMEHGHSPNIMNRRKATIFIENHVVD